MNHQKVMEQYRVRRDKVRKWLAAGKSSAWVALQLGVSRQRISQIKNSSK